MNNLEERKCSISFHNSLTKRKPVTITFESLVYSVRDLKGLQNKNPDYLAKRYKLFLNYDFH